MAHHVVCSVTWLQLNKMAERDENAIDAKWILSITRVMEEEKRPFKLYGTTSILLFCVRQISSVRFKNILLKFLWSLLYVNSFCMLLEISFYKNDVKATETVINQGYCSVCKISSVKSCVTWRGICARKDSTLRFMVAQKILKTYIWCLINHASRGYVMTSPFKFVISQVSFHLASKSDVLNRRKLWVF